MRVDLIEGRSAIGKLRTEWNSVYEADPEASYFLSFDWLFGTPDGAGRGSLVLAARHPDAEDRHVAYFPLRLNTEHEDGRFHNELNLSGNYTSDYTGFLCRPGFESAALPAFADALQRLRWRRLRMLNFAASEARAQAFLDAFDGSLLETRTLGMINPDGTDNAICPRADLTPDWDSFLMRNTSANTRQKIRRFLRQAEGSEEFRITRTTEATFERDSETLIRLWSERWGGNKGDRLGAIQGGFRRMFRNAMASRTLFLPVLWQGDRPVGLLAILVDRPKRTYNFYAGARDQSFNGPSAGLILHAHAIRHAIGEGIATYDFLRGNEPYKYAFGARDRRIRSVVLRTRSGRNLHDALDPRCRGFLGRRSRAFLQHRRYADAERGFGQLLEIAPEDSTARYLRGLAAARNGDAAGACAAFDTLLKRRSSSVKLWLRLGRAAMASHSNWNEIAEAYGPILKSVPDQRAASSLLGRVLLRLGQTPLAIAALEAAARRMPDDRAVASALELARGTTDAARPKGSRRQAPPETDRRRAGARAAVLELD